MRKKRKIKIGYCVAYDWHLLEYSLPQIYNEADEICLSIDKNRRSWTGNIFEFDEVGLRKLVSNIDQENKIKLYFDDFYVSDLSPMQNEVRQRNMISKFMGQHDDWFIQLDADEYFLNFNAFCKELQKIKTNRKVNVCCPFVILFKQVEGGFLFIQNNGFDRQELIPIASNYPHYEFGRKNGYFNLITNHVVFHQSWARSESEIRQKLDNWGHNKDFDLVRYFSFWQQLNKGNFSSFKNFHPFNPAAWENLAFMSARDIPELLLKQSNQEFFQLSKIKKTLMNSIWYSRLKNIAKITHK